MKGINDLPIELYSLIFKNLSISDLFNCRLVNKKFKYSTYTNVHKLMINEHYKNSYDYYWNNNELIDDNDIISLRCFRQIRLLSIFNLDDHLKYLKINWNINNYKRTKFKIKFMFNLNSFINLEYLAISSVEIESKLNINLNNLKYFKACCSCRNIYFELDTPRLEKIEANEMNYISIKSNPDSIKHLITNDYKNQLEQFKNLEIIEFTYVNESYLYKNPLSFFNNLKQLKISIAYKHIFSRIKDNLIEIFNSQMKLNKFIDIYFEGVKILNIQKIREFELCKNIIEYQINNYHLLDSNLSKINSLIYNYLNDLIDIKNNLPSSFFNKFQSISDVIANLRYENSQPINPNNFNWFLNNLKCLKELSIIQVPLDQNFFDNLPNTIQILYISSNPPLYLNINFNFILKFTKLIKIKINDFNIDLFDLAPKSISNSKYLEEFKFCFNDQRIEIYREHKYLFLIYLKYRYENISENVIGRTSDRIVYDKLDYNQFLEKFNKLELNNFN